MDAGSPGGMLGVGGSGSLMQGGSPLACHVLAAASQVLALGEVRRVDHSLKVGGASQYVVIDLSAGAGCCLTCEGMVSSYLVLLTFCVSAAY
jgi:hypothetical protein